MGKTKGDQDGKTPDGKTKVTKIVKPEQPKQENVQIPAKQLEEAISKHLKNVTRWN